MKTSLLIFSLLAATNAHDDVLNDAQTWQKAYVNAYSGDSDTKNEEHHPAVVSQSPADISSVMSHQTTAQYKPGQMGKEDGKSGDIGKSVLLFRLAQCMMSPNDWIANQRDGLACGAAYSCMSFWGQEITQEMLKKEWCAHNIFEMQPQVYQASVIFPYRFYLHNVVTPLWNYIMLLTSPARGHNVDLKTGLKGSQLQVIKDKQECEAADSLPSQLRCMVRKMDAMKDVRTNMSDLSPETFKAMQHAYRAQKKSMSVLESEGLSVLRHSIEDNIPIGLVEINPSPSPSNPPLGGRPSPIKNPAPIGMPGPMETSVGTTMNGMASKNRFGSLTPGLRLRLTDPLNHFHSEALSNDGSPGAFYIAAGKHTSFHVYLPGGYFCYNQEMCFERCKAAPMLCSTKGWEKDVVFSGAMNPKNGGMEGWTHGILGYTSSDAFLGQSKIGQFAMVGGTRISSKWVSENIYGTFFEGLTMFAAALVKMQRLGLGQVEGTTLVVSGCSAAAIGLTPLTDMIPSLLSTNAIRSRMGDFFRPNLVTILDSAPITNGPPPLNGEMPLTDQSQALLYMLYTMTGVDPGLRSVYPGCFSQNGNLCIWSPYVLPHLSEFNMVMHNLWDSFALGNQAGATGGSLNSTTYIWGLKLALQETEVMMRCTKVQSMFGLNCYDHCYVENPWWWRLTPASAQEPYWQWSARETFGHALVGSVGHKVVDQLVQFDSGCIGQEFTNTEYAKTQLAANWAYQPTQKTMTKHDEVSYHDMVDEMKNYENEAGN